MVERNEELATTNLSLKPQLEEKQEQLIELVIESIFTLSQGNQGVQKWFIGKFERNTTLQISNLNRQTF